MRSFNAWKAAGMSGAVALGWLWAAPAARADAIDDYVRAQLARNHIPGLSLAIVRGGRVEKLESYGVADLEWSAAVTDDHPPSFARIRHSSQIDVRHSGRLYQPLVVGAVAPSHDHPGRPNRDRRVSKLDSSCHGVEVGVDAQVD